MEEKNILFCPICHKKISLWRAACTNCGYKDEAMKKERLKAVLLFIILLLICAMPLKDLPLKSYVKSLSNLDIEEIKEEVFNIKPKPKHYTFQNIEIKPLSELSGLTKKEILDRRTDFVKNSPVFKDLNYEPSDYVFQIKDNLPWIGAEQVARYGTKNNENIGKGPSRHSLAINNPELLISFMVPDFGDKTGKYTEANLFLPKAIFFDKGKNYIETVFNFAPFFENNPKYTRIKLFPEVANAKDLGYNWIYCSKSKGIVFDSKTNISTKPYAIQGRYQKGGACGLKSGCNNYAPLERALVFVIHKASPNRYLKIKMWKEKPLSIYEKADMTYFIKLR